MKTKIKKIISSALSVISLITCFSAFSISSFAADSELIKNEDGKQVVFYSPSPKVKDRLDKRTEGVDYANKFSNLNLLGEISTWPQNRIIVNIPDDEYSQSANLKLSDDQYIDLVFTSVYTVDKLQWVYTAYGAGNHDRISKISIDYLDDNTHTWVSSGQVVDINTTLEADKNGGNQVWYYQDITLDAPITTSILRVNLLEADTNRDDETRKYYTICSILPYGTYSAPLSNNDEKNLLKKAVIVTDPDSSSSLKADQWFSSVIADGGRTSASIIRGGNKTDHTYLTEFDDPYVIEFKLDQKYMVESMQMFTRNEGDFGINEADIMYTDANGNQKLAKSLNFNRSMYTNEWSRNATHVMDYVTFDEPFVTDTIIMLVKSAKTSYDGSFNIDELGFYGEEYTETEPELIEPDIATENIGVFYDADEDGNDIKDSEPVTGFLTTVTPNDYAVSDLTWTYSDKSVKSETVIKGDGAVIFGVIVSGNIENVNVTYTKTAVE